MLIRNSFIVPISVTQHPPPRPVPRPGDSDSLGPRGPGMDIFNQEVMIWVQREKLPYLVWHLQ